MILGTTLAVGVGTGLAIGWSLWRPTVVVEAPAPPARQADSSLVLERRPDPGARPAHIIPRGAVVERVATVVVQPNPVERETPDTSVPVVAVVAPLDTVAHRCACAPVTIDLTLIRLADGTRRVIASARGGTVTGGIDVPVEASRAVAGPLRYAAGVAWDAPTNRPALFLDRDSDRLLPTRVGLTLAQGERGLVAGIRVGLRFGVARR